MSATPNITGADYFKAEVRLASFQNLVGVSDPRISRGDRALLVSVSSAWKGSTGRKRASRELGVIDGTVNAFVDGIHLPNPSTITLTSRSGEVPLTFRNDTGQPVRVRVALASDKLAFPQGSVQDVDLGTKATTVRVSVRARTSGTFPLRVTVTSLDGGLAISDTRFRIRSTAVSTVGIALMVGAGVFLAAWWAYDIRRRRRRRAPRTSPPRAGARAWARDPGGRGEQHEHRPRRARERPDTHRILRSSAVVGVGTALSRATGFLRVAAIAYALGVSTLAGVYSYANETPNIVYELLLGGVLTATLVPLFVKHVEDGDEEATSAVVTIAVLALVGDHDRRRAAGAAASSACTRSTSRATASNSSASSRRSSCVASCRRCSSTA